MERHSHDIHVEVDNGELTIEDTFNSDEFIEGDFENYWCDICEVYIIPENQRMKQADANKLLFEHVMKHLGIE